MKKVLIALTLFTTISFAAQAQTAAPAPQHAVKTKKQAPAPQQKQPAELRAKQYSNELKKKLALTDQQYQQILAVNTECIRRKDALRDGGAQERDGKKAIAAYRKEQFATILKPEQMAKLSVMNSKNKSAAE